MLGLSPIEVKNVDSEDAPPYAILEVVQLDVENGWLEVQKPSGDGLMEVVVNSGCLLRAGKLGTAFSPYERAPYLIQYDTDGDTPASGDDFGTTEDEWFLSKDIVGFTAFDVSDSDELPDGVWAFQLKVCSDT